MQSNNGTLRYYYALLTAIYCLGYWLFLHSADYLPYVLDNNETYSSLVHAYNMYFGDLSQTFGLTDEAFSPFPEAHPAIHTHQGNWPRLYAFLLYVMGARNAESQIIIHVFTIGIISIWLMFKYFAKIASNKLAFLACLVFMSDYILFAQWHVVTYRVWHCFFVFFTLNCMHWLVEGNKKAKILFFLNFAALFYWELVFAFYLALWALLYYSFLVKLDIKQTLKCGLYMATSGLAGLAVLFTQLSFFMSFSNAVKDYYLTFFGRNFAADAMTYRQTLKDFYDDKDIAFFFNLSDGVSYKTVTEYLKGLFGYGFEIHTPALTLLVMISCSAFFIKALQPNFDVLFKQLTSKISIKDAILITTVPITLLIFKLCLDNSFLGVTVASGFYSTGSMLGCVVSPYIALIISYYVYNFGKPYAKDINLREVILINIYLLMVYAIFSLNKYYLQDYESIWYGQLTANLSVFTWRILIVYAIAITSTFILQSPTSESNTNNIFRTLSVFLLSSLAAYSVVYMLSPGYVYSGYLRRTAPFIVFFVDVVFILGFYNLINIVLCQLTIAKLHKTISLNGHSWVFKRLWLTLIPQAGFSLLGLAFILVIASQWIYIQFKYAELFPANSFAFSKILRAPQFQAHSIASNQYSLPFAYEVKYWAFTDANIGVGKPILTENGLDFPILDEYLWYKNKKTFEGYKYPEYFVCFAPNSFETVVAELTNNHVRSRLCHGNRVVMQAMNVQRFQVNDSRLHHTIVESDLSSKDRWAIVKLDWQGFSGKN